MAKIEEISELLVAEIGEFEQAVKRLEAVQRAKIGIDITELKEELVQHRRKIQKDQERIKSWTAQFEKTVKGAKIHPTWAVVVFLISLVLNCIATVILIYKH